MQSTSAQIQAELRFINRNKKEPIDHAAVHYLEQMVALRRTRF